MAKQKVVEYVRNMLQKGYDTSSIRDAMIKYGYSDKDFEDALNSIYTRKVRHEIHFSFSTILIFLIIAISILAFAFFYKSPPKAQHKLLDLSIEPVTTTVEAGQSIVFIKQLSNLGSLSRFDVIVKQEIIDPRSNTAITEKTETRAVETFGSTPTEMIIPSEAPPGNYVLKVTVEYDDKLAIATLPVKVASSQKKDDVKDDTIDDGKQAVDCDDKNSCTSDTIEIGLCINKPISPCCGNRVCEKNEQQTCYSDCASDNGPSPIMTTETLEAIKELSKSAPAKALQECGKIEVPDLKDTCIANIGETQRSKDYCTMAANSRIKDFCFSNVAKLTNDNGLCEAISTDSRKDSCYMTVVLDNKDYSVCSKSTNKYLRNSCESLRQLSVLNS
jgi:hypothetical protein